MYNGIVRIKKAEVCFNKRPQQITIVLDKSFLNIYRLAI